MTREEEDRRLALSGALSRMAVALDARGWIDMEKMSEPVRDQVSRARRWLNGARSDAQEELAELQQKAIDETPEEDR